MPISLPKKLEMRSFQDIHTYTNALYNIFFDDFIKKPYHKINKKNILISNGDNSMENCITFWHIITDPHSKKAHDISIARSERLPWISAIIKNYENDCILFWEKKNGNDNRAYLYYPEERYLVILNHNKHCYYLITAYYVDYNHKHKKHLNDHKIYGKCK